MDAHKRFRGRLRDRRIALVVLMGGVCRRCGLDDVEYLEPHHIRPREWNAARMSRWQRLKQYVRDWLDGKCYVICRSCNARIGKPDTTIDSVPF